MKLYDNQGKLQLYFVIVSTDRRKLADQLSTYSAIRNLRMDLPDP